MRPEIPAAQLDDNEAMLDDAAFAADAAAVVEEMLVGEEPRVDRRSRPRLKYRTVAKLQPGGADDENITLYTRDADPKGSGFVSNTPLAEDQEAMLNVPGPDGQPRRIACRVKRSRPIADGWFEGCVEFAGEQPVFCETRIWPQRR